MTTPTSVDAPGLSIPVVTGRTLFETAGKRPIEPSAVAGMDGGVVVAGRTGSRAWAGKIDGQGQILWTYQADKQAGSDSGTLARHSSPEFSCAAPMPDGTVWLAGQAVGPGYVAGLVVHLDAQGNTLFEGVLQPPGQPYARSFPAYLRDCISWGDGVAIVGWTFRQKPAAARYAAGAESHGGLPRPKLAYWVVGFDAAGRKTFDEVIPTDQEGTVRGMSMLAVESKLLISATTNDRTDILNLGSTVVARAEKQYPNGFLSLLRPVQPDGRIQLWGTFLSAASAAGRTFALITLDSELRELQRQQTQQALTAGFAYRMPDQSLVLFGSELREVGERYTSQLMHVDAALEQFQILNPPRNVFTDTGAILAAAPYGKAGRFVMASPAVVQGFPVHSREIERFPGFQRGAVLEFVELL
jgi:hypothetical protein